jgi:hypothetical protein
MTSPGVQQTGCRTYKDCETHQLGRAAIIAVRSAPTVVRASLPRLAARFDSHFAFFQSCARLPTGPLNYAQYETFLIVVFD